MSKIVKLFKDSYSLSMGSEKWISKGADLLKYIGQNIIQVKFSKKSETDPWESVAIIVKLLEITDFEPLTGTYRMTWESVDGKNTQESCRVTPEGFSFGIPEKDLWMYRFLPMSLHIQMTEAIYAYDRYEKLFKERPSLSEKEIEELCRDKHREDLASVSVRPRLPGYPDHNHRVETGSLVSMIARETTLSCVFPRRIRRKPSS